MGRFISLSCLTLSQIALEAQAISFAVVYLLMEIRMVQLASSSDKPIAFNT